MEIQDTAFLKALDLSRDKTVYIRLIALDNEDCPCDEITGRATGGSVNIDGKSAVRRTCSLSLITDDSN
jgi:hypothetical protein